MDISAYGKNFSNMKKHVDATDAARIYIGFAKAGVAQDSPHWQLMVQVVDGDKAYESYVQDSKGVECSDFKFKFSERASLLFGNETAE